MGKKYFDPFLHKDMSPFWWSKKGDSFHPPPSCMFQCHLLGFFFYFRRHPSSFQKCYTLIKLLVWSRLITTWVVAPRISGQGVETWNRNLAFNTVLWEDIGSSLNKNYLRMSNQIFLRRFQRKIGQFCGSIKINCLRVISILNKA